MLDQNLQSDTDEDHAAQNGSVARIAHTHDPAEDQAAYTNNESYNCNDKTC